jgi:hypothetical protein
MSDDMKGLGEIEAEFSTSAFEALGKIGVIKRVNARSLSSRAVQRFWCWLMSGGSH